MEICFLFLLRRLLTGCHKFWLLAPNTGNIYCLTAQCLLTLVFPLDANFNLQSTASPTPKYLHFTMFKWGGIC